MEQLLAALRAAAEPTRLRLLALAAAGPFCVMEFTEILGQSQPRLSRHLKLLCEAGLLERQREGANVWFAVPPDTMGDLARDLLARLAADEAVLEADRRQAARVLAERARVASETFHRQGADWDEMRALDLPAAAVEASLLARVPEAGPDGKPDGKIDRLLDIGTGTGRVLELLAPRIRQGIGVDASKAMLALARARLARAGLSHCLVRLGDMYRLPLPDASVDMVVMQMVLHYAEQPDSVIAEAARVLRPGGRMLVVDLMAHQSPEITLRLAHRWPGFSNDAMHRLFSAAGIESGHAVRVAGPQAVGPLAVGPLTVGLWPGTRDAAVAAPRPQAAALFA